MPGTVGNGGPGNGSVASSLRSESPISSGKNSMLHRYCMCAIITCSLIFLTHFLNFKNIFYGDFSAFMDG